jgi:ATP-dependent Clp protease ATP-binding subunit ClpX
MLFEEDNVELSFTEDALRAIAAKAKEAGTGARALRMIVENLLLDLMYEVPSDESVKEVLIDESCVKNGTTPMIKR